MTESQSILDYPDYGEDCSQDVIIPSTLTDSEYMMYLPEGQSQLRSSDSTPDLYRSTATQTSIKTKDASTQYFEQDGDPIARSANILADSYFVGDESRKKKFFECYVNLVATIIRLTDNKP